MRAVRANRVRLSACGIVYAAQESARRLNSRNKAFRPTPASVSALWLSLLQPRSTGRLRSLHHSLQLPANRAVGAKPANSMARRPGVAETPLPQ